MATRALTSIAASLLLAAVACSPSPAPTGTPSGSTSGPLVTTPAPGATDVAPLGAGVPGNHRSQNGFLALTVPEGWTPFPDEYIVALIDDQSLADVVGMWVTDGDLETGSATLIAVVLPQESPAITAGDYAVREFTDSADGLGWVVEATETGTTIDGAEATLLRATYSNDAGSGWQAVAVIANESFVALFLYTAPADPGAAAWQELRAAIESVTLA